MERAETRKLPGPLIVIVTWFWLRVIAPRSGRPAGTRICMNDMGAASSVCCPVILELPEKLKLAAVASPLMAALPDSVSGPLVKTSPCAPDLPEIGRASCRERVEVAGGAE